MEKFKKLIYLDKDKKIVKNPTQADIAAKKVTPYEMDMFRFKTNERGNPVQISTSMEIGRVGYMPEEIYLLEKNAQKDFKQSNWTEKLDFFPLHYIDLGKENRTVGFEGRAVMYPQVSDDGTQFIKGNKFVMVFMTSKLVTEIIKLQNAEAQGLKIEDMESPSQIGMLFLKTYSASNFVKAVEAIRKPKYDHLDNPIIPKNYSFQTKRKTETAANGKAVNVFEFITTPFSSESEKDVATLVDWAAENKQSFICVEVLAEFLSHWEFNGGANHKWVQDMLGVLTDTQKEILATSINYKRSKNKYAPLNLESGEIIGDYDNELIVSVLPKQYLQAYESQLALSE